MVYSCGLYVMASLLLCQALAAVYDRPLDLVYAQQGGQHLPYNDSEYLDLFTQVQPPITSLIPFFLNVADPSKYDSILQSLKGKNIIVVPAVGGPPGDGDIDQQANKNIARGYSKYSEYIRLENMQGFYDEYGSAGIQSMIDYCVSTLGFRHVMLNPWPEMKGGGAVPFSNPEVDATINQVLLDQTDLSAPTNWYPGNQNKIKAIRAYRPTVSVLINYESPPQQDVLTKIEKANKGASERAMQITLDKINGQYASEHLHWVPPFDQSYNPVALGTWGWIAGKLSQ